jgi:hypothetical protein
VTVWSREGQDTGSTLSVSGQHFLGVGIISNISSSRNPTWGLSYIMSHTSLLRMKWEVFIRLIDGDLLLWAVQYCYCVWRQVWDDLLFYPPCIEKIPN